MRVCVPSALLCLSHGRRCVPSQRLPTSLVAISQHGRPCPCFLLLFRLPESDGRSKVHYLLWCDRNKGRIDTWIFKITPLTRKPLPRRHFSFLCIRIRMCVAVLYFHCSSAVLFIRRAASLSWQRLRGTSVETLTTYGTESGFFGRGSRRMQERSYAVIIPPAVFLLSWQTPTSQLRALSS